MRYMGKALDKGDDYIATELERLTKMAEKPMSGGWVGGWVGGWAGGRAGGRVSAKQWLPGGWR